MGRTKREAEGLMTAPQAVRGGNRDMAANDIGKIAKRSDKVLFIEVGGSFKRLTGMTSASTSKNTKEYNRQYVDESFERTDVVSMSTSIDFALDFHAGNEAQKAIVDIINEEKIGADAVVKLLLVDFTSPVSSEDGKFNAIERPFAVVPNTEGGSLDAYTYEGTMKANGAPVKKKASTSDEWKTATVE